MGWGRCPLVENAATSWTEGAFEDPVPERLAALLKSLKDRRRNHPEPTIPGDARHVMIRDCVRGTDGALAGYLADSTKDGRNRGNTGSSSERPSGQAPGWPFRFEFASGGCMYVLFSSDSDLDLLGRLISRAGFVSRLVAERSILIESMILYELRAECER